jgi:hypothetical protein
VSFCTDEINRYRAKAGVAPLERSPALDGFSSLAAEHDGKSRVPHQYFKMTNGGGVAMAENQLLLWKGYTVSEVIRQGLAQMWAEGPSGSHYQIMHDWQVRSGRMRHLRERQRGQRQSGFPLDSASWPASIPARSALTSSQPYV